MIKLGCNYYPEVTELIEEGKIDIDYFKYPGLGYQMDIFKKEDLSDYKQLVSQINRVRPVMIHGLGLKPHNICSKTFIQGLDIDYVKQIIELSGVNGISLHLAGVDYLLLRKQSKEIIINNIKYLKEQFHDLDFISFENADWNPYSPYSKNGELGICIESNFISEIIYETGSDFLLDISHAYCSSKKLKVDFETYLYELPIDKVYEIHINGWIETKSDIMSHTKINEIGYMTLEKLLKDCSPKIITLEYGRSSDRLNSGIPIISPNNICNEAKDEIVSQITRLREIINNRI